MVSAKTQIHVSNMKNDAQHMTPHFWVLESEIWK